MKKIVLVLGLALSSAALAHYPKPPPIPKPPPVTTAAAAPAKAPAKAAKVSRHTRIARYVVKGAILLGAAYIVYRIISDDMACRETPGCKPDETMKPKTNWNSP